MEVNKLIELLIVLNANNPADCDGDLGVLCEINISKTCQQCDVSIENIPNLVSHIFSFNQCDSSSTWKYICMNFHLLNNLRDILDNAPSNEVLSIQQSKSLRAAVRNITDIGICNNLQPRMFKYRKLPTEYVDENHSVLNNYNRLAGTTYGLLSVLTCVKLRGVILGESFKAILCALYQILYCPLKKPGTSGKFIMTEEIYERLLKERALFKISFGDLTKTVHKDFYMRETMTLANITAPTWLQKAIFQNLSIIMRGPKGIENIVDAMFQSSIDVDTEDTTKNWKILDVVTNLIVSFHSAKDFKENVCQQLIDLLKTRDRSGKFIRVYENIYVLSVKKLYAINEKLCRNVLLSAIIEPFVNLSTYDHKFHDDEDITDVINQAARLTHSCIVDTNVEHSVLPVELFTPVINVIFHLHSITITSSPANELRNIIFKYLDSSERAFVALDAFLFGIQSGNVKGFRDDLYLEANHTSLVVKLSLHKIKSGKFSENGDVLMNLCKNNPKLQAIFFTYLLDCLSDREKYFKIDTKKDLLDVENEFVIDEAIERNLVVYQLLSSLVEDKQIQRHISTNPADIIKYVQNVLQKTFDAKLHLTEEIQTNDFHTVFTIMMILQALVMNSSVENLSHYRQLLSILESLMSGAKNMEFKNLIKSIIDFITNKKCTSRKHTKTKSELDKALEDVCDSLLPVRGHGLMTLTKLVEKRNKEVLDRKQYVLNIFQQNLKNDDSFIYLSAVGGLAAMGNVFPNTVINVLTQEYSDFVKKDCEDWNEVRMKLGEVLVRIIKNLGEVAPKYKSLLLNTFLAGTKDEDHLIRASSLSNLGEICRVLGYKLGSIVIEVLVCVHAIITTDKAVEARRAAVTVIRQLLAGLKSEMIVFLKEDILEIYRTLKNIYKNDGDDVMRLQAQLALEELNENMRNIVFPKPQLNLEKKIAVLK